jgi:hypothetical protein
MGMTANPDCDCNDATMNMGGTVQEMMNPLCQSAGGYGTTQFRAKGYPGLRELQVLKGIGDQAIVASICPARVATADQARPDYGYRPAIAALVSRLRTALRGKCLPRTLALQPDGSVPCVIIEAFSATQCPNCEGDATFGGRSNVNDSNLISPEMKDSGNCFCQINQLKDQQLADCENQGSALSNTVGDGWCYVDPAQQKAAGNNITGACQVVATCPDTDKRVIRFAQPTSEPRAGATAFITCQEASFPANGSATTGLSNPCQ